MMECGGGLGAFGGQVGMSNVREAASDYTVEGARIEQRRPLPQRGELVVVIFWRLL